MTISVKRLRDNVAAALDVAPRHITIARTAPSPKNRSARAWGSAPGGRFFAKSLLRDPYRVMPRVTTPWDDTAVIDPRSAARQIEIEWSTTLQLQRLTGSDHIPAPIGRSAIAKTIVWQDAEGDALDDLVKRRHWTASRQALRTALRQAGEWLRTLHERSTEHEIVIDLTGMLEAMHERARKDGQLDCLYTQTAVETLQCAFDEIGQSELKMPVALSHGDFMLSNLVWNNPLHQLYIVDFEDFAPAGLCQDLLSMIFDLRSQLLNPLIPKQLILTLEDAFWEGYGPVPKPVLAFVNAIASARVSYFHLPQALDKRMKKGGLAGAAASLYKTFLQPTMLARSQEGL